MNEIASKGQLRLSYLRWALFTVPTVVFLGFLSGRLSNSGYQNRWFVALDKPEIMPPAIAFPIVWGLCYLLMGLAIAVILHARGARMRTPAILLFIVALLLNLGWSPIFFGQHKVLLAFYLIVAMIVVTLVTIILFLQVRKSAALLMIPYIAWLGFAATLNYQVHQLNPDAEKLVVPALRTHI
ncbi:MAG: tryptophan-rich sensory protein [Sphingobium sp.]|jgi:tryptophan-rich sensory protein|nr:MAG: tryptophan-rich sensory protein [Sphingobium sp.]